MSTAPVEASVDLSYKLKPNNYDLGHIPGEYGLPVVGRTFALFKDFYGLVDDQYKKYGPVSRIGLIGVKSVLAVGPEMNKLVFLDRDRNFSAEMGFRDTLGQFYGGGLLMRDFDDHRFQRRIFQSAFKNEAMSHYTALMNPVMASNIGSWKNRKDFLFFPNVKETLLDAAATIFLGIEDFKGPEAKRISQSFIRTSEGMTGIIRWDNPLVPFAKWRKGMVAKRVMEDFLRAQIPARRKSNGKDMFTFLCQEKRPDTNDYFSDQDIVVHINFLLFAAHDTTTSNLCYIMQYLGQNPEWQERARAEAQAVGKDVLEFSDIDKMVVMDNIHHEALRMNPSVQMMMRRTIKECEMGGYRIPANTLVSIPPAYSHRMEEYWTNPNKFDPDRWSPARAECKGHPFQFVGFGGGAHKCIGMHFAGMIVKTFLHQMLLNYRWRTPEGYDPIQRTVPLPKQEDNLPLILEPLTKS